MKQVNTDCSQDLHFVGGTNGLIAQCGGGMPRRAH